MVKFRLIKGGVRRGICMAVMSMLVSASVYAQTQEVTGTVTSAGQPLAGATVVERGTANGTSVDGSGNFTLRVGPEAILEVGFIGYVTETVTVGARTHIDVVLYEDAHDIETVVAIGYGVQKKKLNTGATVQVKGDDVAKMNNLNPVQALQGLTPGVQISSESGQPGSDMKVSIRGVGTNGKFAPLYIIDGIEGDMSRLNPADIESIDVLKDAASAAIYGSQAANGVVLVTTKQGRSGNAHVTFDAYYGIQKVARKVDMLNAEQFMTIMNEQAVNSNSPMYDFSSMGDLADTKWLDHMFQKNAKTESYNIGVTGGSESSVYSISLNYAQQEGIVGGSAVSNYERYGFRTNTEHKLYKDILKVGQHLYFSHTKKRGISVGDQYNNTLRGAFETSPLSPVYSDNNIYGAPYNDTSDSPWNNTDGNPYGTMMLNTNNINRSQGINADVYAELTPLKGLSFRTTLGINYNSSDYRSYSPIYRLSIYDYSEDHNTVTQNMSKDYTITWINTGSYDFNIGDHSFNVLLGSEAVRYTGDYLSGSNWNLLEQLDSFAYAYLGNTTGQAYVNDDGSVTETRIVSGYAKDIKRRMSYFGRVSYNYREKYLLNVTLRGDGSSNFAKGNRWGLFPSASAGWVLTGEPFMEPLTRNGALNFLKLRASWGQVGNQDIDPFQYMTPINTSTNVTSNNPAAFYPFGTNNVNYAGSYPLRLSNEALTWETSEQTNIGIDARFLGSRLGANLDFYIKDTKDWLVVAPILATAGAEAPFINGGKVRNTGFELAFNWYDRAGDFGYSVGVNGAWNKNKVKNIPTEDGIIHGKSNMLYNNSQEFYRAQSGHPIGYFWGYQTAGIFQSWEDIDAWRAAGNGILQADVKPGDVKYVDQDKSGTIDIEDKVDLGNGMPKFTFGLNIALDYKGFDLSVNAYGVTGNKLVQSYRNHSNSRANYTTRILNRWTGEGTSNSVPRVTEDNINWQFSDLFIQKGDYLRITNITLGYDFAHLTNKPFISQMRLYVSVHNPFTFTKYEGMDPDVGYGVESWVSGVDLGFYPRPRTFMCGVALKF